MDAVARRTGVALVTPLALGATQAALTLRTLPTDRTHRANPTLGTVLTVGAVTTGATGRAGNARRPLAPVGAVTPRRAAQDLGEHILTRRLTPGGFLARRGAGGNAQASAGGLLLGSETRPRGFLLSGHQEFRL